MAISGNSSQVGSLAMSLAVSPLVVAAIILRFIATRKAARRVGAEDWSAFLATISCLGFNVLSIWCICLLNGREFTQVPLDTLTSILKASYITTQFFPLNQFFAKISILLLYHRIFGINRLYARWIWGIGIAQTLWTLAAMLTLFFQCQPVRYYWDRFFLPEGGGGKCISEVTLLVGFEVPNSSIDFAMVVLALVMLRDLKMRRTTRWKVAGFFAAGGFAGIIGFLKIAAHFTAGQMSNTVLSLWGNAQMLLSILCCCVPIYNSLFSRRGTHESGARSYPGGTSSSSSGGYYHSSGTGTGSKTHDTAIESVAGHASKFPSSSSGGEKIHDGTGFGLGSISVSKGYGVIPDPEYSSYRQPGDSDRRHTHRPLSDRRNTGGPSHSHSRNSSTDSSSPVLVPKTSNLTTSTNYTSHTGASTDMSLTNTTSQTPLFDLGQGHEAEVESAVAASPGHMPIVPEQVQQKGGDLEQNGRDWEQLYEECSRDLRTPIPQSPSGK